MKLKLLVSISKDAPLLLLSSTLYIGAKVQLSVEQCAGKKKPFVPLLAKQQQMSNLWGFLAHILVIASAHANFAALNFFLYC